MVSIDARRQQLEDRLRELKARLGRIEQELEQPVSDSFSEQAVEREEEEVLEDLGAAGAQEVRMIGAALKRIEAGTYGTCANCGEQISEARLDVLPATPICKECAAAR
jgi:RNA polymerase-binding transcription factor DksA